MEVARNYNIFDTLLDTMLCVCVARLIAIITF